MENNLIPADLPAKDLLKCTVMDAGEFCDLTGWAHRKAQPFYLSGYQ